MKQYFDNEETYVDVLKLFYLYIECVIGADELFILVEKFFENDPEDLFERFKNITLS